MTLKFENVTNLGKNSPNFLEDEIPKELTLKDH